MNARPHGTHRTDRGVALLIALLITTLLMALIMEFAYGSRLSLRAAVNFRDGQRAYYLARSGVNFAGKVLAENLKQGKLQDNLEQREWQVVPIVSGGEVELRVRWEDEAGKISLANLGAGQPALVRLERLFETKGVGTDVLDRLREKRSVKLLGELHQLMSDEDFGKVRDLISVTPGVQININTAPAEVLQSAGLSASVASLIVEKRGREPFDSREKINAFPGMDTATASMLGITGNSFRVQSTATVGGYTKQVEAVITRNAAGFTVQYWRSL